MKRIFKLILLINIISQSFLINISASEIYHNNELKKFFIDLKNSKNLDEAIVIEKNIWNLWNLHPNNQFLTNKLQTKAAETQQEVIAALTPDFQRILGELINAKDMDMVLSPQALFYADPDFDITDEVTALLDVALAENSE